MDLPRFRRQVWFLLRHDFVDAVTRDDGAVLGDPFRLIKAKTAKVDLPDPVVWCSGDTHCRCRQSDDPI